MAAKFGRAQSAAREMGRLIAFRLSRKYVRRMVVTYVPTAPSRVHQRGYDQAELLARAVARKLELPCSYLKTTVNKSVRHGMSGRRSCTARVEATVFAQAVN